VLKTIWLLAGHNALYIRHETSSFRLGMAAPRDELANAGDEYYSLQPGVRFSRLDRVPTIWNTREDCTTFPRRYGFMDLAALYAGTGEFPAWTSAAVPSRGYLWYALKDAAVLPQLLLWMDNGGRHAFPWDGRNRCLGLEDGCAFFDQGLSASARANPSDFGAAVAAAADSHQLHPGRSADPGGFRPREVGVVHSGKGELPGGERGRRRAPRWIGSSCAPACRYRGADPSIRRFSPSR
jgi:hypothetical protein